MQRDYATAVEAWERYLQVEPNPSQRIRGMLEMARANLGSETGQTETPPEEQGNGA
jgi:cytochrome c-type biogenesis protein CcmH/NrfG